MKRMLLVEDSIAITAHCEILAARYGAFALTACSTKEFTERKLEVLKGIDVLLISSKLANKEEALLKQSSSLKLVLLTPWGEAKNTTLAAYAEMVWPATETEWKSVFQEFQKKKAA